MDASILDRPARTGARLLALDLLDEAAAAAKRWRRDDPEGLHDFRVAVRRLRTCLRVHRARLSVRRKDRRRLRALARATGAARDRDVLAATVEHEGAPRELVERLAARAASRREAARRLVRARLPKARRALRKRLARPVEPAPEPTFGEAVRGAVAALAGALGAALARADDDASLHRARIAAKELRYTLEVLGGEGQAAVAALAGLQDLLGRARDLGFAVERLAREARADERCEPKRAHAAGIREALLSTLRAEWRGDGPGWAALRRELTVPTVSP